MAEDLEEQASGCAGCLAKVVIFIAAMALTFLLLFVMAGILESCDDSPPEAVSRQVL